MAPSSVWYVYGIVEADLELDGAPTGLDDAPLALERADASDGRFAALVSSLDGDRYSAPALERDSADVEWLSHRAIAHDRVLTWASDKGAVVPLPILSAIF